MPDLDNQAHRENLVAFFKANEPIWESIVWEIDRYIETAEQKLKGLNCQDRSFYAGYCSGLEELKTIKEAYKRWQSQQDKST